MNRAERLSVLLVLIVLLAAVGVMVTRDHPGAGATFGYPRCHGSDASQPQELTIVLTGYTYQSDRFSVHEGCVRMTLEGGGQQLSLGFYDPDLTGFVLVTPDPRRDSRTIELREGRYRFGAILSGHRSGGQEAVLIVTSE